MNWYAATLRDEPVCAECGEKHFTLEGLRVCEAVKKRCLHSNSYSDFTLHVDPSGARPYIATSYTYCPSCGEAVA